MPLENGDYRVSEMQRWKTDAIAPDGKVSGHFEMANAPSFAEQAAIAGVEL